ncbi:MAG: hypothetical protein JWN48_2841 [Myxococcaceae bacterium]|nr:hypothetical protein [Myxococcaceae bacterium]
MFAGMSHDRGPACISDLRFDQLLAEELNAGERHLLHAHVASCARCRAQLEALRGERAQFQASELATPAWLAPAPRPKRRTRGRELAVAAACMVGLAFLRSPAERPRSSPSDSADSERAKGGDHVSFYVKRGERVQRGSVDEPLHPGDQLRFTYTTDRPRYVALISIDAAHHTCVYYPPGARALQVDPGREVPLPSAIELDHTLGVERVAALFCDEPIDLAALQRELARGARAHPGCVLDVLTLHKTRSPE